MFQDTRIPYSSGCCAFALHDRKETINQSGPKRYPSSIKTVIEGKSCIIVALLEYISKNRSVRYHAMEPVSVPTKGLYIRSLKSIILQRDICYWKR
jgi:hypothetical protein